MKTFKMIDPNLIRLYRYFMPYKWRLGFACVFLMGSASMSSITATLLGKMADLGFYQQESWMIYAAPVALIAVTVGFAFCTVMSAYLMAQVSQSVLLTMRGLLFEHILHWPESEFQKHTSGRMSSKFVNEAASSLSGAVGSFTVLVRDSVQVAALLDVLFWQDWKLTLVTFVIIPGLAVTLRFISKRIRKIVGESQELLGGMISRVQETYEAERLVKVSNAYDFEERRFADVNDGIRRLSLKSLKLSAVTTPVTQILTLVAIACVVGVALYQAQHGMLTIGEFVTFLSALLLIKAPIQHLSGLSGTFAGISVAAESIFETLDSPVETEGTEELEIGPGEGRIEFEHVVVRYPGKDVPAVRDFSLTVRPGECIAVVGQSGSGKTTLINLLPRFLEPESGRVMIDGRDIRDFRLGSLRSRIAFVTQDVVIFDDTLRNNLTYGLENVTDEQIREALEAASLTEMVAELPDGLDTRTGDGGSLFSGGQKQRISIARAFLRNAPILIMDEATSALDSKTEKHVSEAMGRLRSGRTCLVVAHRLSTIADADRIVVMKDGCIIETGSYDELMAAQGAFARLVELQTA